MNRHGYEWIWLFGIGLFTQVGQIGITKGLSLLPASKATAINYMQVVFAAIWGILFFSERISLSMMVGGLCVFLSTAMTINASSETA